MSIKFWASTGIYGCFSNFSPHPITVKLFLYKTTEHYFQSMKYLDWENKKDVIYASTPKLAAAIGRDRNRPLRSDWEEVKNLIMYEALSYKIEQHPQIKSLLLSTENEEIIEDSPYDSYWGCGRDGKGLNMLGKTWMRLREELKKITK